ncbi:hypothetical protein FE772_17955 [Lysobacter enzymogenes]|nr:hypothetical protein [Lysobacter enzymogenes]QCW27234.1 hypothetical protein FE772_17955 [Lysobacter enzymogenes]
MSACAAALPSADPLAGPAPTALAEPRRMRPVCEPSRVRDRVGGFDSCDVIADHRHRRDSHRAPHARRVRVVIGGCRRRSARSFDLPHAAFFVQPVAPTPRIAAPAQGERCDLRSRKRGARMR